MPVEIQPKIGNATIPIVPDSSSAHAALFAPNALLAGISSEIFNQVSNRIQALSFEPDEMVFAENDPGDCLYLIAQGSIKISKRGRGGQQETLAYLLTDDYFGEMALVDSGKRSAQASAVGKTILGRIDRSTWDLLLRLTPQAILTNFTRSVTQRLRQNNQHFIEQMMRNERLSLLGTTVSSIVHDMNNPINCIMNACEVIRSKSQGELTEQMTRIIRDSVKSMETMTRELVDFSRGRTQLYFQPFLVKDLLNDLQPHFNKCRPFIDVHIDAHYEGQLNLDRYRLARVFANLVRNAREAMGAEKNNHLRLTIERIESKIRFALSDTGPGIPKELLPQIFEPFVTHGKADGTGLGLAISKAVVEAHHGTISVSSSEQGTTFQIELPLDGNIAS